MKFDHLIGLEFDWERQNCYQLIRQLYADNWGIELTDYSCPTDWVEKGMDLFNLLSHEEGFTPLHCHPREYRPGDVTLHAIQSSTGSHISCITPTGELLTHLVGQRSAVLPFGGMLRNTCLGVYRHRDVPAPTETLVDIRSVLPEHVLRRLAQRDDVPGGDA